MLYVPRKVKGKCSIAGLSRIPPVAVTKDLPPSWPGMWWKCPRHVDCEDALLRVRARHCIGWLVRALLLVFLFCRLVWFQAGTGHAATTCQTEQSASCGCCPVDACPCADRREDQEIPSPLPAPGTEHRAMVFVLPTEECAALPNPVVYPRRHLVTRPGWTVRPGRCVPLYVRHCARLC